MKNCKMRYGLAAMLIVGLSCLNVNAQPQFGDEWISLFNGVDFTGWEVSEAAAESWSVVDGVIKCDPRSQISGDRNIWTENSFGDFVLYIDWRFTDAPIFEWRPLIGEDGKVMLDDDGNEITMIFNNADSGIYLRGASKAQVNIWNWPIGSGEVYGYRNDSSQSDEVRAGLTPSVRADRPVGEWNTFIIKMTGDRLTVLLNGSLVIANAQMPDVPESGPLALQYHGGFNPDTGQYRPASSLVEFKNIYLQKLD